MNRRAAVTRLRETSVADLSPPVARKTWQTGGGDRPSYEMDESRKKLLWEKSNEMKKKEEGRGVSRLK